MSVVPSYIDCLHPQQKLPMPFKIEGNNMMHLHFYTIEKLIEWYKNYPIEHRIYYLKNLLEKYIIQNNLLKILKSMKNIDYGIIDYNFILNSIKNKYTLQDKTLNQILMTIHDYLSIKMNNIEVRLSGEFADRQKNILINKRIPLKGSNYCYIEFYSQQLVSSKINEEIIYGFLRDNFILSHWNDSSITYTIPGYDFHIIFKVDVVNSTPTNYITTRMNTHTPNHKIIPYTKEVEINRFFLVYI